VPVASGLSARVATGAKHHVDVRVLSLVFVIAGTNDQEGRIDLDAILEVTPVGHAGGPLRTISGPQHGFFGVLVTPSYSMRCQSTI